MLSSLFPIGFVLLGIWRLCEKEKVDEERPLRRSVREKNLLNEPLRSHQALCILLALTIFTEPSFEGHYAAIGFCISMFFDGTKYPLDGAGDHNNIYHSSRIAVLDIIYFYLWINVFSTPPEVLGPIYFIKLVISIHFFWNDFLDGSTIDRQFWRLLERLKFVRGDGEPDENNNNIPEYRKRINQWIGLALFVDNRLVYCVAFCAVSFFLKYYFALHRVTVPQRPSAAAQILIRLRGSDLLARPLTPTN